MYKSFLLLCLVGVVCSSGAQQDLDSIIRELFGTSPTATEAPTIIVPKHDTIVQPVTRPIIPIHDTIVQPVTRPIVPKHDTIVPALPVSQSQEPEDQPCTSNDVKDGQCVTYYLCDANNTIIQDGVGVIDIRSQASDCPSYLDICCKVPDAWKKDNSDKQIKNPNVGCGWRNRYGVDLETKPGSVGKSLFGEFPWMVAILRIETVIDGPISQAINVYVGGGSLIHPAVVLTTAHHLDTIKTLKVRAGEWDTQNSKEIYPHQDREVESIIVHEDFNTKRINLFYDIALLFLSSPMDTSIPNVGLACLPPPNQRTRAGESCVASGWGKDKFGNEGRYHVTLKKVTVPVVERRQCQTQLRKTHLGRFFELHSTFMCAGGEAGIDTCKADGGSPLMCPIENEPNRYMQSGMVAWGVGCGNDGVPGVYVDVSNLREWVDDKIVGKGLDPKVYTF